MTHVLLPMPCMLHVSRLPGSGLHLHPLFPTCALPHVHVGPAPAPHPARKRREHILRSLDTSTLQLLPSVRVRALGSSFSRTARASTTTADGSSQDGSSHGGGGGHLLAQPAASGGNGCSGRELELLGRVR